MEVILLYLSNNGTCNHMYIYYNKYFHTFTANDCTRSSNGVLMTVQLEYEVTNYYSQLGEDNTTLRTDELVYEETNRESFHSEAEAPNNDITLKTVQGILYEETTPLKSKSKECSEQFYTEADIPIQTVSDLLLNNLTSIPSIHPSIHSIYLYKPTTINTVRLH